MINMPVHKLEVSTNEILAYREVGSKKTILLLHGNMSSSVHFIPLIEKLKDEYHVIALDLVGFGDSTYNRQLNSLYDFAQDVVSFIELKDLHDIHIVGWSTGGGIALEVASILKDRISKVSLLSSVGPQGFEMYDVDKNRIESREDIANHPVQVLPILQAYEAKNKDFIKFVWDNTIYIHNKPNDEDYEIYLDAILKQRNLVDVDYALVHFNISDENNGVEDGSGRYKDITANISILHGSDDLVVPVTEAHKMKDLFKEQATLKIFQGAGHAIIEDDLDGLVEALTK